MPKHTTQCPWLNLTNLGGLTRQSNEKADKEIKIVEVDVQFVDFPFFNAGSGKERNAVQAMGRLFQNRCFYSLTLRYKYFRIFPVHLQIAL